MKQATRVSPEIMRLAEQYVRDLLAIMYGSTEAGINRIGLEQFDRTIWEVAKSLQAVIAHELGSRFR